MSRDSLTPHQPNRGTVSDLVHLRISHWAEGLHLAVGSESSATLSPRDLPGPILESRLCYWI
jgi:hypothetical protein